MTIIHNAIPTVNTHAVLYSLPDAVRQLAIVMLVNMAEANTEMAMDTPEEYNTKAEFENVLQDLPLQALDMIPDLIHDLEQSLRKQLNEMKYTAKVVRMDYKEDGELADVTVKLNVE
jgi:hypothetical protein